MQSAEKGEAAGKLLEPGDMFGDYTMEKLLGKSGVGRCVSYAHRTVEVEDGSINRKENK